MSDVSSKFQEFTNAELVIVYHALNAGSIHTDGGNKKVANLMGAYKTSIWQQVAAECGARGINVIECTVSVAPAEIK